ncbi:LacI family transcriptional regulator [Streptomyces sp. SID13666]|uniref:LacI family DNA-binding transcriptional regulator n=1 Tax=Streptomyces TaxID=1883 RepID=UPI0011062C23|nr:MULTISPECIES: LacI family DNA-binding transcriptional regulator [Streptomyces]MCZ4099415.1 LacI family DNA-binding transcriptional regulator [Streptomyces sp. H39-C1]NEA56729.1 LacI family transcriptional regulator [Streptomyces sp. SID13666]NEA73173.1 LacI family transcriptional regulator [Streptomyces sp. SID13588]QNA74525.1 LacI family transcriptional regulator [Streptomyces sp. So13.3]
MTEAASRAGGQRRVTIRDVAERAGVSVATVSRVLAGNYPTSAAARAKVLRAVKDLDYVIDARARALAGTGPKTVAVIVQAVDSPFYAEVAQGVEQEAAARGRLCLVCSHGGDIARELALVQMMREQRAEVVVLVGGAVEDEPYRARLNEYAHALSAAGSRLVLCGRPAPTPDMPVLVVEYDNEAGAYAITSHLLSAGHRRILFLGGIPGHSTFEPRLSGYRRALADHGLDPEPAQVSGSGMGRDNAYAAVRSMIAVSGGRPEFTAVFAGDDLVAAGAMSALRDAGLRTPEDVSVVGYNNEHFAQDLNPPLTTVHIPSYELGREAVRIALSEDVSGGPAQRRHLLGTHIVVRDSVGRAPRG